MAAVIASIGDIHRSVILGPDEDGYVSDLQTAIWVLAEIQHREDELEKIQRNADAAFDMSFSTMEFSRIVDEYPPVALVNGYVTPDPAWRPKLSLVARFKAWLSRSLHNVIGA